MVIDNEPKTTEVLKPSQTSYSDTVSQKMVRVMSVADDSTTIVADNISAVNAVADKINDVIQITTVVKVKIDELLAVKYGGNTKNSVDILDEAIDKFNASMMGDIVKVRDLADKITTLSSISDTLVAVEGLSTTLTRIDNNLAVISNVGAAIDNVNVVDGLKTTLEKIVDIQDKLVEIYNRMTEIKTIYEYLPELLQIYEWILVYKKSQEDVGFTNDEFNQSIIDITKNITALLDLNGKLTDVLDIKNILDNAPTLVADIKTELDNLLVSYTTSLSDDLLKHKRDLANYVTDQLMAFIKTYVDNSSVTLETLAAIKLKLETAETKIAEIEKITDTVDVINTKIAANEAKIAEIEKITDTADVINTKIEGLNEKIDHMTVDLDTKIETSKADLLAGIQDDGTGIKITRDLTNNTILLGLNEDVVNSKFEVKNFSLADSWATI